MSRPDPRQQALSAAFAGAIDLSALNRPAVPPGPAGGQPADEPSSQFVVRIDETRFSEAIEVSNEILVVFELWSPRSAAGAPLSATLQQLAGQGGGGWILARVDVDTNPRIAQAFGAQAVPTVVAVAGGQPVDAFTGVQSEAQVTTWISGLLAALRDRMPGIRAAEEAAGIDPTPAPEPEDPRFTSAEALLDTGDFAGAKAAYQAILAVEPANSQAAAALAQADLWLRVDGHPEDAVDRAARAPEDVALQSAAADVELAAGNPQVAFDRMIALVSRTAGDDRTAAREHLIGLFALFPVDDELVRASRRKLAAALY